MTRICVFADAFYVIIVGVAKFCIFLILFNGNSISSIYTDTKLLYICEHFFSLKTANLIIKWVPYKG